MGSRIAAVNSETQGLDGGNTSYHEYIHQCEMQRASKPLDTSNDYENSAIGLQFYSLHGVPFSTAAQLFQYGWMFFSFAGEISTAIINSLIAFNQVRLLYWFCAAFSILSIMGLIFCCYNFPHRG